MRHSAKSKRNQVLGVWIFVCLALTLASCRTAGDSADDILPESTPNAAAESASADTDVGGQNIDSETSIVDSDLLQIYLVGETAEGIDPWDNANLDALESVGDPLLTSELLIGYYEKCDREHYPDPAAYGEIIPGENSDRGRLYYNLEGRCVDLFYQNFANAGGEDGKQYGVLLISKGEKLMCALFDTGSGLATPQNAQIGLSANRDDIFLWGAFGELGFSEIIAGALPGDLYFTAERLREKYDQLVGNSSLSDIVVSADTVTLGSGMRDEITFSEAQISDFSELLDRGQYLGRSFELSEEEQAQRGFSVMSINVTYGDGGHAYLSLYEDIRTIDVAVQRENQWVQFDGACYDAQELVRYMDDLSQDGMPKLFELTDITEVKVLKNGDTQKVIDDAAMLDESEEYLSDCRRTPLMNLHGSAYEIFVTADGIAYTMRPDDNINDALIFDGHQYQVPDALWELLGVY